MYIPKFIKLIERKQENKNVYAYLKKKNMELGQINLCPILFQFFLKKRTEINTITK